ncbi:unnamed protein product [Larinioides sclopetarius]|uniref:C2H2-type domain-containing protein n=1 Tax=Larinioides sclopetarius TaxID=280406 RepID=A0AAV2BQ39_9ARAC
MESEENLQFSEYSPQLDDSGSESPSHVKENLFLNVVNDPEEKESFVSNKRENIYEDDSQFESYRNLVEHSEFLDNQFSDPNSSPYLGSLEAIQGFEIISEDLSNESSQVDEVGKEISLPPSMVPKALENTQSAVILQETETRQSDPNVSPSQISASVDSQSTFLDNSENRLLTIKDIYAEGEPYSCSICNRRYRMKSALIAHLQTHLLRKLQQCKHCQRVFRDASSFISHLNTHTEERPYACTQCDKRFETEKVLKEHEIKHTRERPHVCEFCERGFAKKETLKRHLRTHTGRRPYVCSLCPKAYSRKHHLDKHLISHSDPKEFICETCGRKYLRKHYFKQHRKTHQDQLSL